MKRTKVKVAVHGVSEGAGVCVSTVSRVLNDKPVTFSTPSLFVAVDPNRESAHYPAVIGINGAGPL